MKWFLNKNAAVTENIQPISLSVLDEVIGNRADLSQIELIKLIHVQGDANALKLKKYYEEHPLAAKFVEIVEKRREVPKEFFKARLHEFFEKHPEFHNKEFQKNIFEEVRSVVPDGAVITVHGGFAVMRTVGSYGRSPKGTMVTVNEGSKDVDLVGFPSIAEAHYLDIRNQLVEHLRKKGNLYSSNLHGGQGRLKVNVKTIAETPEDIAFTRNMFRDDFDDKEKSIFEGWTIIFSPSFKHPDLSKYDNGVFKFFDFKRREVIIGGTSYRGEVKKSVFAIINMLYPLHRHISFHCSALVDKKGDVTLNFGLSGTGKSTVGAGVEGAMTLSDDETGIDLETGKVFNLENGNYYKTGGLLDEPKVLAALDNPGVGNVALYENVVIAPNSRIVFSVDPTDNGRVSLPLTSLPNAISGGSFAIPKRIIILSRDLNAVLDLVNVLKKEQILAFLMLGYTSRTAGTEVGVTKSESTFSKWQGGPFYFIKDNIFIDVLWKDFLNKYEIEGYLLNTGESGGPVGSKHNDRMSVKNTLEISRVISDGSLSAELNGDKHNAYFEANTMLGTWRPKVVEGVSEEIELAFNAESAWIRNGYHNYEEMADELMKQFREKLKKMLANVDENLKDEILKVMPLKYRSEG